jgi:WD40 repeat protein
MRKINLFGLVIPLLASTLMFSCNLQGRVGECNQEHFAAINALARDADLDAEAQLPSLPALSDLQPLSSDNIINISLLASLPLSSRIYGMAVHPDRTQLAVHADAGTFILSDNLETIRLEPIVRSVVALSADGIFARGYSVGIVELWQTANGRQLCKTKVTDDTVVRMIFSPDGMRLFVGSSDKTVRVLRLTDGRIERVFRHDYSIFDMDLSRDGQLLVTVTGDDFYTLWDVQSGKKIWSFKHTFRGGSVVISSVAFNPDGKVLAIGSWPLALVYTKTGETLYEITDHKPLVGALDFTASSDILIALAPDGLANDVLFAWRVSDGALLHRLEFPGKVTEAFELSQDGKLIVIGNNEEGTLEFWGVTAKTSN